LELLPEDATSDEKILQSASRLSGISTTEIKHFSIHHRSIDARQKPVKIRLVVHLHTDIPPLPHPAVAIERNVENCSEVHIAGMGPAGMFAALHCIELGLKPVILERGKNVRERRRDLAALTKHHIVNPDSNYCFGEGGAGTYSDGKLYTRSHKRGNVSKILDTLVHFGASPDILIDSHPHIGTNKLPGIIENIRNFILSCGGQIHFNTRIEHLEISSGKITGFRTSAGDQIQGSALILATGHSARDVFYMLQNAGLQLEAKPFALGVRVEHPQSFVDATQYHCSERHPALPAASYSLLHKGNERNAFSFCMCPGGIIAPCATSPGEVVTNGWSPSRRDNPFANSGIVVEVSPEDFGAFGFEGPLAGVNFQQMVEQTACSVAGGNQTAPAQRITDFLNRKSSANLPDCSYLPGIAPVDLRAVLPDFIFRTLCDAFKDFGNKMRGFVHSEAVVVATESRTSSPVRIPRLPDTLMHPQASGLFPCGEGAGYAGGIVSAAMDGIKCAEAAALFLTKTINK
jgi:uncharacterized FAD-dependent dehydrogenase